ncbi:MAG: Ig-like domain-containing protein, partial [Candidatus Izemoplasmatales bacterium]
MKRTTRFILVLFVAVFSLIVAGCNGQTTTQAPTTLAPTTQAPTTQAPTTQGTTGVVPTTLVPTTLLPTSTGTTTTEEAEVFVLLDRSTARLDVGIELTLVAEMTDMSSPTFVWTSSNPLVASVSEGVVTALTSGQTTIRVSVGTLYAECIVTVDDVIDLIFPVIAPTAFVGDQIDLGAFARVNGVNDDEHIEISGSGFSHVGNLVTFTGSGIIQITVSYPGAQSVTRSITVYHEVKSIADFHAIKEDLTGYYMMTADIDYAGEPLDTIAHYSDGYTSSENGFSGVFDGNGHTISNFYAYYSTNPSVVANSSPFG